MFYLGQRMLKEKKKDNVENGKLNTLVSWELSTAVMYFRLHCMLSVPG